MIPITFRSTELLKQTQIDQAAELLGRLFPRAKSTEPLIGCWREYFRWRCWKCGAAGSVSVPALIHEKSRNRALQKAHAFASPGCKQSTQGLMVRRIRGEQ
jgi:hypothetical protein